MWKHSILLKSDGTIQIEGANLNIKGSSNITIKGQQTAIN